MVTLSLPVYSPLGSWVGSNLTVKVQLVLFLSPTVVPARLPPESMQVLRFGSGLTENPADTLAIVTDALTVPTSGLTLPKSTYGGPASNAKFGSGSPGTPRAMSATAR